MMNFKKRVLTTALTVGLVGGVLATAAPAAWAKGPAINGVGTVSCTITKGMIKFSPGLSATPTDNEVGIKITETCTSATYGTVTGKVTTQYKDAGATLGGIVGCSDPTRPPIVFTVKWKSSTKLNTSTVSITRTSPNATNTGFDAPATTADCATATPPGAGSCTVTGSFAGATCTNTALFSTPVIKNGVLKKLNLTGGTGTA